ncbi:hypothetical protein K443DRAFT_504075 [Laccaria amethystina LaAM-08-1]|uniref:Unplaced genomic scaffold K443scaffold_50, whole genome shotgun sequence n=1 Tax=Laccaria amethystina LaAM-08-1 TaxID=1095629 RepID=A0A0C9XDV4_9AGAR|nr:hypothetical protein K443DRAFT_504075 [Laccaria amethystina LaAM-08-1]
MGLFGPKHTPPCADLTSSAAFPPRTKCLRKHKIDEAFVGDAKMMWIDPVSGLCCCQTLSGVPVFRAHARYVQLELESTVPEGLYGA